MQGESSVIHTDLGGAVLTMHLLERLEKILPKMVHPLIVPSELILDRFPGNELRPSGGDAVKALRQPGINIEGHG